MRNVVSWLLGVFLSVGIVIDSPAQSLSAFTASALPSAGGGGITLSLGASGKFAKSLLPPGTTSATLEARILRGQDFFSFSPSSCATVEEVSTPFVGIRIQYTVSVVFDSNSEEFNVSGDSCSLSLTRKSDSRPFGGVVAFQPALCSAGLAEPFACFAAPESIPAVGYSLVGLINGQSRPLASGNESLSADATYALALESGAARVNGPIPDEIQVTAVNLPSGVNRSDLGLICPTATGSCACPVSGGQSSCPITFPKSGIYEFRISSSLIDANPVNVRINREEAPTATISREPASELQLQSGLTPNTNRKLSARVSNAPGASLLKLESSGTIGGIACGHGDNVVESQFQLVQDCTIEASSGVVRFQVRSSSLGSWSVKASLVGFPAATQNQLYNVTSENSGSGRRLVSTSEVPSQLIVGRSSSVLAFKVRQEGTADTDPTNLTFSSSNEAIARWRNKGPEGNLIPLAGCETQSACRNLQPVLESLSNAGVVQVKVSSNDPSDPISDFSADVTVTSSSTPPTPRLAIEGVPDSITVSSSPVTARVSIEPALGPLAVRLSLSSVPSGNVGPGLALPEQSNFGQVLDCPVSVNSNSCSFQFQAGTRPGTYELKAQIGDDGAGAVSRSIVVRDLPILSALGPKDPQDSLRSLPNGQFPAVVATFQNAPDGTSVVFEIAEAAVASPRLERFGRCEISGNQCDLPPISAGSDTGRYTLRMRSNNVVRSGPSATLIVSRTGLVGQGLGNRDQIERTLRDAAAGDPVALGAVTPVADLCVRNDSEGVSGPDANPLRVTCSALIDRAEATDLSQGRADVRAALRAINGEEVKGLSDASIAIQRQRQGLVSSRLQEVRRGGGRGFSADGLSIRQGDNSVSIGQALALGKSLAGMNDTAPAGGMMLQGLEGWGGFISGNWSREDRKDIGVDRGFDLDGYNVLLGVDREVISGLVLGFAFGAANSKLDYLDFGPVADRRGALTGSIDTDSRSFSAYASAAFANGMSLDGSLSYGRFSHRFDRIVDLSGLNRGVFTNRTDVDGSEWIGNLNLGYPVELKQIAEWTQYITVTKLTPTLGLVYGRVRVDGFTETENDRDNVWRLKVPDHSYSQLQAVLSVDMHNSWELIYRDSLLTVDAALQGYVDVLGGSGGDATQVLVDWATFNLPRVGRDSDSFISFKMDDRTQAYGTFELGVGWSLPGSLNLRLSSGTYFGLDQSSRYYINLGGGYTF